MDDKKKNIPMENDMQELTEDEQEAVGGGLYRRTNPWQCPNCGKSNAYGYIKCTNCGTHRP